MAVPMLRTSERAAFKRCPQRWWWAYREGLRLRSQGHGALWFGTGFHLAFAEWYIPGRERGRDPRETWREYVGETFEVVRTKSKYQGDLEEEFTNSKELGELMLTHYLDTYGDDPHWDVIAPEQIFAVLIPDPEDASLPIVDYRGTFDGVFRDLNSGKLKIMEHKTAAQISTKHLPIDDQAGSYIAVASHILREMGELKKGEFIAGVEYNFLAKRKPDTRPRDELGRYLNKDGSISKRQSADTLLREFVARPAKARKRQIERIGSEAVAMDMYRSGALPLIKNPTKDCSWDCDFFELCQIDEQGGDVEGFKKSVYKIEDPYMDHRSGARNTKESVANMRELKG